mmetsp:Transcript_36730/g.97036  ORF Transcript_36730/g.97036 Transcript_36730/m.97036 type:complete len:280 (+) Transcript_36730:693-1532(+)
MHDGGEQSVEDISIMHGVRWDACGDRLCLAEEDAAAAATLGRVEVGRDLWPRRRRPLGCCAASLAEGREQPELQGRCPCATAFANHHLLAVLRCRLQKLLLEDLACLQQHHALAVEAQLFFDVRRAGQLELHDGGLHGFNEVVHLKHALPRHAVNVRNACSNGRNFVCDGERVHRCAIRLLGSALDLDGERPARIVHQLRLPVGVYEDSAFKVARLVVIVQRLAVLDVDVDSCAMLCNVRLSELIGHQSLKLSVTQLELETTVRRRRSAALVMPLAVTE